ncbi:MAG: glycosyltransferase family 2 protein [Albidovulum sp.]|uniref:glycosyltransferase family 2 protein n=1 Tax=Albidovulum sp. TaxID=1872424 RepID=UPI003C9BCEDE
MRNDLTGAGRQNTARDDGKTSALIVVPCLNEASYIGNLLAQLLAFAERSASHVVVVDGGSTDGTLDIVQGIAATHPRLSHLHNPKKIQSAGINLAVRIFGAGTRHIIRIDAHCGYPDDYCAKLIDEAEATGAGSIVVAMIAAGRGPVQRINAAVQNSRLGNGGSRHRRHPTGQYVDHGHHALILTVVFNAVGGYDESFRCNEDAELDYRITQAGYRIWLTARTAVTYYPRQTLGALFRQYFSYGQGRARTVLKHRIRPIARQAIVLAVAPSILTAALFAVSLWALLPMAIWALACLGAGAGIAIRAREPGLLWSGCSAMVMHAAWSFGFWQQVMSRNSGKDGRAIP